jgi:hypothetical protein
MKLAIMTADVVNQIGEILGVDLGHDERSTIYLVVNEPVVLERRGLVVRENEQEKPECDHRFVEFEGTVKRGQVEGHLKCSECGSTEGLGLAVTIKESF